MLARFQDLNNDELNHTIKFLGFTQVDVGQNDTNGHFLDKPSAAIVPRARASCDAVTEHHVFVYTTFTGNGSGGKFQSKINFAKSVDGGRTFARLGDRQELHAEPGQLGGRQPDHEAGRRLLALVNSPHTIVMRKRTSNGNWSKPVDLLSSEAAMVPFDQPMLGAPTYAFRSNGFPAAAITPDGSSILVAWQELWSGTPRVVVKQVNPATGTGPARVAAAAGTLPASLPGLGFFNNGSTHDRTAGDAQHQLHGWATSAC